MSRRWPWQDRALRRWCACLSAVVVAGMGLSCARSKVGGTEVRVLLDFSRSFAPFDASDERVLKVVAESIATLAADRWEPPVRTVWQRINEASLGAVPECGPLEFEPRLTGSGGDRKAELRSKLLDCVQGIAERSRDPAQTSAYTDIGAAIRLAVEEGGGATRRRIMVVYSDLREDLPPGRKPVEFRLSGQEVVLIHRPGRSAEDTLVVQHLQMVDHWKQRLVRAGAASVVAIPAPFLADSRLMRGIEGPSFGVTVGFALLVDCDLTGEPEVARIGKVLAQHVVRATDSSIVNVGILREPFQVRDWLPPIRWVSSLTHRVKDSDPGVFQQVLNGLIEGVGRRAAPGRAAATAGLRWVTAGLQYDTERHLIVISRFRETAVQEGLAFPGQTNVILVAQPDRSDASAPESFFRRLDGWRAVLKRAGATVRCRLQLKYVSETQLEKCLQTASSQGDLP